MLRWQVVVVLLATVAADRERVKRQISIDDLISRALSLVRPIFDTSQPLQNDEMLKKQDHYTSPYSTSQIIPVCSLYHQPMTYEIRASWARVLRIRSMTYRFVKGATGADTVFLPF
ncbi:hypothetical protein ANCDUO_05523 [Ancylostoma duodenale]|uniref:Uncharacterized protein n=1 Tax=Ancylostoma duodenale TaxID=51022 RepID=A0A0C2H428_9BILA|nr:hypothetical protein ANCDUO_05523 [Ancylostoma duodenale]